MDADTHTERTPCADEGGDGGGGGGDASTCQGTAKIASQPTGGAASGVGQSRPSQSLGGLTPPLCALS